MDCDELRRCGRVSMRWSFVLALTLGLAGIAPATDAEPRTLRVGTSGDYPPFSERVDVAPGYRGFDVSIAEAFARDLGYQIDWVKFGWPRLAADMKSGRFDLAMSGITVRPDRSVLGRFSVPVVTSGAVLLFSEAAFGQVDTGPNATVGVSLTRFDRPEVRIAVNRGGHLERVTRARFERASIRAIPNNTAVRQALADRRVDAVVTDTLEAPIWRRGLAGVSQFGPFTRDTKAYWVAPGLEPLSRELDSWLLEKERDGTLARLRESAFANDGHEQSARPLGALLAAIDERLAIMPWVAESKRRGGIAVEDLAQEIRVVDAGMRSVRAAADQAGVNSPSEAVVGRFYRAQIEAAKAIQRRTLRGKARQSDQSADLQSVLRPALMRIGDRMAQLIVAVHQERDPARLRGADFAAEVARVLRPRVQDEEHVEQIRLAIASLGADPG